MKKIFLLGIFFILIFFVFAPKIAMAWSPGQPIVPCTDNCKLEDFFTMFVNLYSFIVLEIAGPLAIIALVVGGIFMMVSAGNPSLMSTGKSILKAAIIGLILVFASWVIINFILTTIGFQGNWQKPF